MSRHEPHQAAVYGVDDYWISQLRSRKMTWEPRMRVAFETVIEIMITPISLPYKSFWTQMESSLLRVTTAGKLPIESKLKMQSDRKS